MKKTLKKWECNGNIMKNLTIENWKPFIFLFLKKKRGFEPRRFILSLRAVVRFEGLQLVAAGSCTQPVEATLAACLGC